MKLRCARPICRAQNCFSPSLALYQHFVLPYNHAALHQYRFASSAPPSTAADTDVHGDSVSPTSLPSSEDAPTASSPATYQPEGPRIKYCARDFIPAFSPQLKRAYKQDPKDHKSRAAYIKQYILWKMQEARKAASEGEEYKPCSFRALPFPREVKEPKFPWAVSNPQSMSEPMARLNEEINAFWEYVKPSKAETFARKNVIEQVRAHVRELFPDYTLEVFGSERTGLAFATSDIDLRILHREALRGEPSNMPPALPERKEMLDVIQSLHRALKDNSPIAKKYRSPVLRHARYPLVEVQDRDSGLDIQIVSSNDSAKSREYMQRYMVEYPYIRQVYAVVKALFDQRKLSDVFLGGFGSYSIFMMLVASLQSKANQRKDAAGALVNFLYYWAYFKTRDCGVSVSPPEYFDKKLHPVLSDTARAKIASGTHRPLPDWMLCLRDPADETNDLGRKSPSILHVQYTLRKLVNDMVSDLNTNVRPSLLLPLVGNIHAHNAQRREKIREHGQFIQRQMQQALTDLPLKPPQPEEPNKGEEAEEPKSGLHAYLDDEDMVPESAGDVIASSFGIHSLEERARDSDSLQKPKPVPVHHTTPGSKDDDGEPSVDKQTTTAA